MTTYRVITKEVRKHDHGGSIYTSQNFNELLAACAFAIGASCYHVIGVSVYTTEEADRSDGGTPIVSYIQGRETDKPQDFYDPDEDD